jgi:hypothetical protein
MPMVIAPPAVSTDETLDVLLSPTHDVWIEEAGQLLMPPAAPGEAAWDRWAAIRYLNEGLVNRLRAERELMRGSGRFSPCAKSSASTPARSG